MIKTIKHTADIPVLIDDNYGVMKVDKIGCECGADVSCFSTFKLQGPEAVSYTHLCDLCLGQLAFAQMYFQLQPWGKSGFSRINGRPDDAG